MNKVLGCFWKRVPAFSKDDKQYWIAENTHNEQQGYLLI